MVQYGIFLLILISIFIYLFNLKTKTERIAYPLVTLILAALVSHIYNDSQYDIPLDGASRIYFEQALSDLPIHIIIWSTILVICKLIVVSIKKLVNKFFRK